MTTIAGTPWWAESKRYHILGRHKKHDVVQVLDAFNDKLRAEVVLGQAKVSSCSHDEFCLHDSHTSTPPPTAGTG